jgi:hypothetical protein
VRRYGAPWNAEWKNDHSSPKRFARNKSDHAFYTGAGSVWREDANDTTCDTIKTETNDEIDETETHIYERNANQSSIPAWYPSKRRWLTPNADETAETARDEKVFSAKKKTSNGVRVGRKGVDVCRVAGVPRVRAERELLEEEPRRASVLRFFGTEKREGTFFKKRRDENENENDILAERAFVSRGGGGGGGAASRGWRSPSRGQSRVGERRRRRRGVARVRGHSTIETFLY